MTLSADLPERARHAEAIGPAIAGDAVGEQLGLRQLRHHTKNSLQQMIWLLHAAAAGPAADATDDGSLLSELERRIRLSAEIADQLFGLTRAPAGFATRLEQLCRSLLALYRQPGQEIAMRVEVAAEVRGAAAPLLLRVAHELVSNSLKHGLRGRPAGAIAVTVERTATGRLRLGVADDGWGIDGDGDAAGSLAHEGFELVRALIFPHHGVLALAPRAAGCCARVELRATA